VEKRARAERSEPRRLERELAAHGERHAAYPLRVTRGAGVARLDSRVERLDRVEEVLLDLA
jgi:hypothetical protein